MSNQNFFLIGGGGRSGTTILSKIFSKHSQFAVVPEWRFVIDPDGLLDFLSSVVNSWTPYIYSLKLQRLETLLSDVEKNIKAAWFFKLLEKLNKNFIKSRFNLTFRYSKIEADKYE